MSPTDIAVVGRALRVPGARTVSEFWENLRQGVESIRRLSDEELRARGVDAALLADPAYVKRGAPLDDTELFDAGFFGFSPREAAIMDPQHRHFLEVAWEALEDAGHPDRVLDLPRRPPRRLPEPRKPRVRHGARGGRDDRDAPRARLSVPRGPAEAETIPSLVEAHRVTHFQCTPTMAQILFQDEPSRRALGRLRQLLVGGEALPNPLARELAGLVDGVVTNVYGPTETTVWSSVARVSRDDSPVTIGFPIANTSLHVLDRDGRLAPVGLAGELHIGGRGVVRGYWNRPELTAERFVPNPFGEGRLYRTGDLVRRREDGALEFLGRLDHQVKVRGHRIELGEIEARLAEHPAVREAVVVARDDGAGVDLVGYVVPRAAAPSEGDLREHLRDRLPEHMLPRTFVALSAFPMTPNRKVDRKALPVPHRHPVVVAPAARPEGALEETVAAVWREVLELPEVGVDANFADLGATRWRWSRSSAG